MRVALLYDDELYGFDPAPFMKDFDWELVTLHRPVFDTLSTLAKQNKFDVYFNLCDGAADEEYPGLDVVQALEKLNLAFTGADSRFYNPTREQMQAVADANGIGFAKGGHVESLKDFDAFAGNLRYPFMVKPPQS